VDANLRRCKRTQAVSQQPSRKRFGNLAASDLAAARAAAVASAAAYCHRRASPAGCGAAEASAAGDSADGAIVAVVADTNREHMCEPIEDIVQRCNSTLLIGQAGVGKSTTLREMCRLLSDMHRKIVVVVDTTSELGGFGVIPHRALGTQDVTRLEVKERSELFQAMLDALQNHSAQVVVMLGAC
jgi:hypothetical protein